MLPVPLCVSLGPSKKLSQDEISCTTSLSRKMSKKKKKGRQLGKAGSHQTRIKSDPECSWVRLLMNPQTKDFLWRGPASPRNELLSSLCHCQCLPRRSLWDVWLRHKKHTIVKGMGAVALAMLPAAGRVGGMFPRLPCLSFITHSISSYILCHIYESLFH